MTSPIEWSTDSDPRFELEREVVDGVHCFGVPGDRPILTGVLRFGFGYGNERLHESGWQHLIEHEALEGLETGLLDVNGTVSFFHTDFEATGPVAEVVTFFERLTLWLSAPTFTDLARTRMIMESEAGSEGPSPSLRALAMRWGSRGPGVAAFGEIGVGRATADLLVARCAAVFNHSNAVMHFDGPVPAGLRLHLPNGVEAPRPEFGTIVETPAQYEDSTLTVTGIISTGDAGATIDYLEHGLTDLLRNAHGATYDVDCEQDDLVDGGALVTIGIDLHPSAVESGAKLVVEWLNAQIAAGPDPKVVATLNSKKLLQYADPAGVGGLSTSAAWNCLDGGAVLSNVEHQQRRAGVTPADVQSRLVQFRETLLIGLPEDVEPLADLPVLVQEFVAEAPPLKGRGRSSNWPSEADWVGWSDEAVVTSFNGQIAVWPFNEIDAVVCLRDDTEWEWHLTGADGYGFSLIAGEYQRLDELREVLRDRISPERFVPSDREPNAFTRLAFPARWFFGLGRVTGAMSTKAFWSAYIAIAFLMIAAIALHDPLGWPQPLVWSIQGVVAFSLQLAAAARALDRP